MRAEANYSDRWREALDEDIKPAEWRVDYKPHLLAEREDTNRRVEILSKAVAEADKELTLLC